MQKDEIKHHNFAFLAFRGFYLDYLRDVPADLKATWEPHLVGWETDAPTTAYYVHS